MIQLGRGVFSPSLFFYVLLYHGHMHYPNTQADNAEDRAQEVEACIEGA